MLLESLRWCVVWKNGLQRTDLKNHKPPCYYWLLMRSYDERDYFYIRSIRVVSSFCGVFYWQVRRVFSCLFNHFIDQALCYTAHFENQQWFSIIPNLIFHSVARSIIRITKTTMKKIRMSFHPVHICRYERIIFIKTVHPHLIINVYIIDINISL